MSADHKALIRRWFKEVWNEGRASSIDDMLAARGVAHGLGEDLHGPAGFKPFHSAFRDAFPDIKVTIEDVVEQGNLVAARWTATGTHRGNGLGVPATGKPVRFQGMTFARIEGGQIVEGWNTLDQLAMFQQLGVVNAIP